MQRINLYQAEFHISRNWERTGAVAVAAVLVLLLAAINIGQVMRIGNLEQALTQKNSALQNKRVALDALRSSTRPKARDMDLAAQVEKLGRSNVEKARAINFLKGAETSNIVGFSYLLQSLGRQRDNVEDIWLTRISFSDGGFHMRLSGNSYRPELLPVFVQALNQEILYRDREFRDLRITRSNDDSRMMDFLLDTRERDKDGDTARDSLSLAMFLTRLKLFSETGGSVN